MANLPAQPIQGLIDGITVLHALASRGEPCSASTLGRELGLEKTRVHRILGTFTYLGIAHRTPKGRYTAGPGIHVLAAQSLRSSGLMQRSSAHLAKLDSTGYITALGTLWRDKVSYLYHHAPGLSPVEAVGGAGPFAATLSSIGIALLALQPEEDVRRLYAGREVPGFGDLDSLLRELPATRSRGYAIVHRSPHDTSIAVALGAPAYAAIALAGDIAERDKPKMAVLLQETVHSIEGVPDEPS
jgi:DNA-binding IclR family transcriptional regulator